MEDCSVCIKEFDVMVHPSVNTGPSFLMDNVLERLVSKVYTYSVKNGNMARQTHTRPYSNQSILVNIHLFEQGKNRSCKSNEFGKVSLFMAWQEGASSPTYFYCGILSRNNGRELLFEGRRKLKVLLSCT